jgi:hypothetical protein
MFMARARTVDVKDTPLRFFGSRSGANLLHEGTQV